MKAQTDAHFYQSIFDFVIYHLRQIFFSHVGTKPPLPGYSLILKRVCITLTLFKTSGKHDCREMFPLVYRKTGVCRGKLNFLIFDLKHTL